MLRLWLCAACASLAGCSSDTTGPTPEPELRLTLRPDAPIVFPAEGGRAEIVVSTDLPVWEAVSDQEWCRIETEENRLTVFAGPNATTSLMPLATVTVTAGTPPRSISTTLKVSQERGERRTVNLSASGTANCYLIGEACDYLFDATVRGNGAATQGLEAPAAIAAARAELVWQTTPGMINGVELTGGQVAFSASGTPGNALIAVENAQGEILWSWHIWFPESEVGSLATAAGYEVMNLNLGAMCDRTADPGSYGLLYQWGRKDPFPAAATLTGTTQTVGAPLYDAAGKSVGIGHSSWSDTQSNTLAYAIAHPTVCLSNYAQYSSSRDWLRADQSSDALWGNPAGGEKNANNDFVNKGSKSFYDPCPVGWRVPPADVFRSFTTSGGYTWTIEDFDIRDTSGDGQLSIDDYDHGWTFNLGPGTWSYFPAAARYDGSYAMLMGSVSGLWGSYWGNAPYPGDMFRGGAYSVLSFQIKDQAGNEMITATPAGGGARADAYSVRCIRE